MENNFQWTREDEIKNINKIQDEYVQELKAIMLSELPVHKVMKAINFTSPTGTGKTKMMAKLINSMPGWFFIVTTLSRGQLNKQVEESLKAECINKNFVIFGAMSLKSNSKLQSHNIIELLPRDKKICWIRDEGHIDTKNWFRALEDCCDKIINFSATNQDDGGIVCNFTSTMMLRTVNQNDGSPEDAILKLIDVKKSHKNVDQYNPCLICRVVNSSTAEIIEQLCGKYNLKFISLVDNTDFDMSEICEDDNEYDVVINKQKITEGIDIRRAHVLWLENQPNNVATIIQTIGRCRRNALLWRTDIDILDKSNAELLEQTRQCYVFYNVSNTNVTTDENGELAIAFCPYISIQKLKAGHTIYVRNGQMNNGLYVCELDGKTGRYFIDVDNDTGFNIVDNDDCYRTIITTGIPAIDDWISALRLLKYKPQSYWTNIKKWHTELIQGQKFTNKKYILNKKLNRVECTIYNPMFDEDGNVDSSSNSRPLFDIKMQSLIQRGQKDAYSSVLSKLKKTHVYSEWIEIDKVCLIINNKNYMITLNELSYIINFRMFDYNALDINNRTSGYYLSSENNHIVNLQSLNINKQNDRFLSMIGIDLFRQTKNKNGTILWTPSKAITDRLEKTTKLDAYIENYFSKQLDDSQESLFYNENDLGFDKKCNSCIGYCVEYYAKYKLFGESFLGKFIKKANNEFEKEATKQQIGRKDKKAIIIRACMLKYKEEIGDAYGKNASFIVPSITVHQLISKDMKKFVKLIDTLGTQTAEFIKTNCDFAKAKNVDNRLITKHLIGLMDICDSETIIDVKCTNKIDRRMIKQVLSYSLLSQYRQDLNIKTVIVYDAVSQKYVKLDVGEMVSMDNELLLLKETLQLAYQAHNVSYPHIYMDCRDFNNSTNYKFYIPKNNYMDWENVFDF